MISSEATVALQNCDFLSQSGDAPQVQVSVSPPLATRCIVVVGSGPTGVRFVMELLKLEPHAHIRLLGNEPVQPYDRVQLSSLLAGQVSRDAIDLKLPDNQAHPNFSFKVATVKNIARERREVIDSLGEVHGYDQLVLATGARPHIPGIPGNMQTGVYQFRTLQDAEAISARVARSVHAIVLGGGLLGLEAARALLKAGTRVTLIQQGPHLMNRQLDEKAASMLLKDVEALGIRVITDSGVREILGEGRVMAVRTRAGDEITCDTVVICAGISPNKELALEAGLKVRQGILVNDELVTSDPHISAIGECCEHQGATYGLASPGFEQAAIAANVIVKKQSRYQGSMAVTRLKVIGQQVCSMGDVVEPLKRPRLSELHYSSETLQVYRKLTLLKGRVIGALAYGDWPESARIQSLYQNSFYVWPWQRLMFRLFGRLWLRAPDSDVNQWPDRTIVCHCQQVTKGDIDFAVASGSNTLESVQAACGASTICGTCKPLVAQLVDKNLKAGSEKAWKTVLASSALALIAVVLLVFWPESPTATSVREISWFEKIWSDKFWKQVSGFSLLGMTVIGLLMSLRKRFDFKWMGQFAYWRAVHTILGLGSIVLLIFHTGFHAGQNLNQILLIDFLLLVGLGSSAGAIVAMSHYLKPASAARLKKFWTWAHIVVSWPLPALLAIHILSVYYF